jgi:hypothetical protein
MDIRDIANPSCLIFSAFVFALPGCDENATNPVFDGPADVPRGHSGKHKPKDKHKPKKTRLVGLEAIGVYETGAFDASAAEISAFDPGSARLFVVNGAAKAVDVLDLSDPTAPTLIDSFDVSPYGDAPTSVDVADGLVAVAIVADPAQDPGSVVLFTAADLTPVNAPRHADLHARSEQARGRLRR